MSPLKPFPFHFYSVYQMVDRKVTDLQYSFSVHPASAEKLLLKRDFTVLRKCKFHKLPRFSISAPHATQPESHLWSLKSTYALSLWKHGGPWSVTSGMKQLRYCSTKWPVGSPGNKRIIQMTMTQQTDKNKCKKYREYTGNKTGTQKM